MNQITPRKRMKPRQKDDTMQKNKTEDKDDTNVIWERKKKILSKKREMMNVLCPYLGKEERTDEEYKEFANLFLRKVWDLQDMYESRCERVCQNCLTSFPEPYYFAIPCMYGYPWKLRHQTPDTAQYLPNLKMWFNNITDKLRYQDKQCLCNFCCCVTPFTVTTFNVFSCPRH